MAKSKSGLGKTALIEDLTKPIRFHLSGALEPPPPFERRKPEPLEEKEPPKETSSLFQMVMKKTGELLGENSFQVVFSLSDRAESLVLETVAGGKGYKVFAAAGEADGYDEVPWDDSSLSAFAHEQALEAVEGRVTEVNVMAEEQFIKFASLADFYEWLDI